MPNLLGTAPNQVPTNGDLGKLAFMDVVDTVTNNPYVDTAISDTKPSLLLDFANSKTLDPRITYTRASTASYYDGKTTAVAEQNLLPRSQEFDNSIWVLTNATVVANSTTAPDGTTTADTLTPSAIAGAHTVKQTGLSFAAGSCTMSFYAKAGGGSYIQIYENTSSSIYANFDIATGALGTVGASATATITSVGGSWYRCTMTFTNSTSSNVIIGNISSSTAVRAESWTAAGTESIYIWGVQVEQRSSVSSYTPTTSSPITNYIPALQTAAAGVPRFDHDPVTGESKGFLIEEQRTNLLTYSADFSNAAWTKTSTTVTADTVVAPDGTITGDKIVEASGSAAHYIYGSATTTAAAHALSIYAKAGERSFIALYNNTLNIGQVFDLNAGVIGSVIGTTPTSSYISPVGNGWFKCSIVFTATAASQTFRLFTLPSNTSSTIYTGDGYSGLYIWGAQLEAGSFATSYIPTTSAQVTRSADAASITGGNFSSWYNQAEGTLYGESQAIGAETVFGLLQSGSTSNRIVIFGSPAGSNNIPGILNYGGTNTSFSNYVFTPVSKSVLGYAQYNSAATINGNAISTNTTLQVPLINYAVIGQRGSSSVYFNGTIKKLAYYPKRLSNAELQEMTQ